MKKRLALLTLASIMLTSSVPVYASGGTSTTMNATSSFTSELAPTDLSQIVVSIPDNMDLALNNDKTKFISSGNVSAKGTLKDGYQLSVSTNESATYKCTGKPDVAGTVTFGTQIWSSAQLEASKTTLDSRAVSVEVANSDSLAAGTYTTNILFNIGVSEAHVHTAGSPVVENRTEVTDENYDYYDSLGIINTYDSEGNYIGDTGDYVYDEVVYCTSCHAEMSRTLKLEHVLTTTIENYYEPYFDSRTGRVEGGTYDEVVHCTSCSCSYEKSRTQKDIYCEEIEDHTDTYGIVYDYTNDKMVTKPVDDISGERCYYYHSISYNRLDYTDPETGNTETVLDGGSPYYFENHDYDYDSVDYWDDYGKWYNKAAFNIEDFNDDPDFDYINNYDADHGVYDGYGGKLNECPDKFEDKFASYHYAKGHWGGSVLNTHFILPRYLAYPGDSDHEYCYCLNTSLADRAFVDCAGLRYLTLPDTIKTIGSEAFKGCTNLQSITLPSSVTSIGANAVNNCSSLGIINYKGTKAQFLKISGYRNILPAKGAINVKCSDVTLRFNSGVLQ